MDWSFGWDELFFSLINDYKKKSKDPSSKFAAIAVNDDNIPIAFGFNGFPRKVLDTVDRYEDRDLKYKLVVHAEANVISSAAAEGTSIKNCRLYVDAYPCSACMGLLINARIKEIVLNGDSILFNDEGFNTRWAESIKITKMMCDESGVKIRIYHKDKK